MKETVVASENTIVRTATGSLYEIDYQNNLVRRLVGTKSPTSRTGEDGVWKTFQSIELGPNGMLITWRTINGIAQATLTSPLITSSPDPRTLH
jgi:hypothetical protein